MISKQFLVTAVFMGIIAVALSVFFRLQLGWPGQPFSVLETFLGKWAPGGVLDRNAYLALVTIHGTIMVFFVLTGGLSGTFSNLLIPLQIGARDMASGFLNMLSYWFFLVSSIIMIFSLFVEGGAASGGWTVYPPLSALPQAMPGSGTGMTLWLISMVLFVASSLLGGLNYIVTVINLRTKGMKMLRLPLTIWAFLITAILGVLSFPVLVSAVVLLLMDRSMGTAFYLSDIFIGGEALDVTGGSPILYQHLFWFLGHPEVYIVLLPALGISSEVIATNARKPIFGYRAMIGSILAIGFLELHCVGTPHVCDRYEPVHWFGFRLHNASDCHSICCKGVQLHHYAVAGQPAFHTCDALLHWFGEHVCNGWSDGHHLGRLGFGRFSA